MPGQCSTYHTDLVAKALVGISRALLFSVYSINILTWGYHPPIPIQLVARLHRPEGSRPSSILLDEGHGSMLPSDISLPSITSLHRQPTCHLPFSYPLPAGFSVSVALLYLIQFTQTIVLALVYLAHLERTPALCRTLAFIKPIRSPSDYEKNIAGMACWESGCS